MKQFFLGVFLIGVFMLNGQDVCHGAIISTNYDQSKYFEVIDVNHQLDFSVAHEGRNHIIQADSTTIIIEKGKTLFQSGIQLGHYNKNAFKLSTGKEILETRTEDGWEYRLDDELILTAYFSLDRVEDCYYLCFETMEWNEESKLSAYLVAARFTKSVPMSRISLTAEDILDIFVDVLYFFTI